MSDAYDSTELPWPDAKVCSYLCVGGTCKYVVREGSGVTNDFILQSVVPNIWKRFSPQVSLVLWKCLLWVFFSSHSSMIADELYDRIKIEYEQTYGPISDEHKNRVRKV